jgi:membrane-bound serine protease (ClpP class)
MSAKPGPTSLRPDNRKPAGRRTIAAVRFALLAAALAPHTLLAEEKANSGLVVQVPGGITTESTNRLRTALYVPLKRFGAERAANPKSAGAFYLVLDFNPDGKPNASEDFGACLSLAEYLRELNKDSKQGVRTVAFVHGDVTRHAVLPVLACSEVVMSSEPPAHLGKVTASGRTLERKVERVAYEDGAGDRLALIRKMYDPSVVLFKARPGRPDEKKGPLYFDAAGKPRPEGDPVPDFGPGDTALYTAAQARAFGLCQQAPQNSLDDVLSTYRLSRASLYPSLDHRVAWRILVSGTLNGELKEKVQRRVRRALGQKANVLIFQLACSNGESQAAHELGLFLAGLNDNRPDRPIETIAFVTNQARDTAAFLAFGCTKIVFQRPTRQGDLLLQEGGRLGDFERYVQEHPSLELVLRRNLAEVARKQHYPAILAEGMLNRDLRIYRAESIKGDSAVRFLTEEEVKADRQGEQRWGNLKTVKPHAPADEGKYLTLEADTAREWDVSQGTAASFEELCEQEGLSPTDVHTADSDWLDDLADFLRDPWTSVVLVMLGITCLILELKMPGVVLPGVIAAVCFVLFFWSHSQLGGQITWLAILLFVLGLLLIALEIFVLPGFGVAGISGTVLVVGSLGLVAYGHWPHGNEEWVAFGHQLGPFGLSILGALVAAFVLARYLPSIPYVNRLILHPAGETEEGVESAPDPMHAELAALLGAIGVAATPLRPAGKAQFGEAFVDVVAEGGYVVPGTRVQVIEIEGNRVVVKEV